MSINLLKLQLIVYNTRFKKSMSNNYEIMVFLLF